MVWVVLGMWVLVVLVLMDGIDRDVVCWFVFFGVGVIFVVFLGFIFLVLFVWGLVGLEVIVFFDFFLFVVLGFCFGFLVVVVVFFLVKVVVLVVVVLRNCLVWLGGIGVFLFLLVWVWDVMVRVVMLKFVIVSVLRKCC